MRFKSSKIFLPISWIYGLLVSIRNLLYDEHLLFSHRVSVPTICVGNLAVGGTGKTPHVEYIIRLLVAHGYKVAILSRGYKRKTRGFVLADDAATALTIGDEPMQFHRKFPEVTVAVCENRVQGIRRLMKQVDGLQCVVLDDAFQYRSLICGYNILLTDYHNLYTEDHFLPAGYLRDSRSQVHRAHAVIVTRCPNTLTPIERRIITTRLGLPAYVRLYFSRIHYDELPIAGQLLVVTGIAHPEALQQYVARLCPSAEWLCYPDHHVFRSPDIAEILERARHCSMVLTTEKDYERMLLTELVPQLGDRLRVLPISPEILLDQEQLDKEIVRYVSENLRKG